MTNPSPTGDTNRYEIRVSGRLDARWSTWFDGLVLTPQPDGTTVIQAEAIDQAALHGVLRQVRDAGLSLVSVTRMTPPPTDPPGGTPR
jgi:hypothetical protein